MSDGHVNKCKECNKKDVREDWNKKRDEKRAYDQYRHRYSIPRLFNHKYAMIKQRCTIGRSGKKLYFVTGKEFLSKDEWIKWCYEEKNYKKFMKLYSKWVEGDFSEKLNPSIDRINSKIGYLVGNLQWLSKSDNCKKWKN